jgi:sec-independent protein translocase protein TatC
MSVAGVLGLFRARPQQPVGADGRMALVDHLRELRARILRIVLALLVVTVVAFFFYDQLLALVFNPYRDAVRRLPHTTKTVATINGVGGPLLLQLKLCGVAGLVVSSPYWLYQIWAFIVPGLHPHEKRWTRLFAAVAGPLFLFGVAVGYVVLPKGLQVLISFTPADLTNLVEFGEYFSFMTRMLLVFGVAFEIPLFVVLLNLAGIVSGRSLANHRPWIIVGTFVFAAVATPSTDPFSMLMLAIPMSLLFLVSELIARGTDRRRAARRTSYAGVADDEASPLEHDRDDYRRSGLDEDED